MLPIVSMLAMKQGMCATSNTTYNIDHWIKSTIISPTQQSQITKTKILFFEIVVEIRESDKPS